MSIKKCYNCSWLYSTTIIITLNHQNEYYKSYFLHILQLI